MFFVDIHTHKQVVDEHLAIVQKKYTDTETLKYFSVSVHPWDVNDPYDWDSLKILAKQDNCLAIGETGLDKLKPNFEDQKKIFVKHIHLANESGKPLIIHCVKAFDECFSLLKEMKVQVPVIFHGFNKHENLGKQIIKQGYYLSFGKSLFSNAQNFQSIVKEYGLESIFFETDDGPYNLQETYFKASELLDMELKELTKKIEKNFKKLFR